jgi:lysophospholipase L1-like esterase
MILASNKFDTGNWDSVNPNIENTFIYNSGELQMSSNQGFTSTLGSNYVLRGYTTALKNIGFEVDFKRTSDYGSLWFGLASLATAMDFTTGILVKPMGDYVQILVKNFGTLPTEDLVGVAPLAINQTIKIGFEINNEYIITYYYLNNQKIILPKKIGAYNAANFALKCVNGSLSIINYKIFSNYNGSYEIMFHGDSITDLTGSYAKLMQENYRVALNAGVGDVSGSIVRTATMSNSFNKEYDVVLIGTNDFGFGFSLENYELNLIKINAMLNKNKDGKPYFLDLLPRNSGSVNAYRSILHRVIPANQIIPTHDLLKDFTTGGIQAQYSSDGLHPNALGNKVLKNMLKSYFEKLIN